jgi:hypothetical protein
LVLQIFFFKFSVIFFSLLLLSPLGEGQSFISTSLNSLYLRMISAVLEKKLKMQNVQRTDGRQDARTTGAQKAHLSFQLR